MKTYYRGMQGYPHICACIPFWQGTLGSHVFLQYESLNTTNPLRISQSACGGFCSIGITRFALQ
jgi:lipid-A-disaccharide synthase-like uncharacterized protein